MKYNMKNKNEDTLAPYVEFWGYHGGMASLTSEFGDAMASLHRIRRPCLMLSYLCLVYKESLDLPFYETIGIY